MIATGAIISGVAAAGSALANYFINKNAQKKQEQALAREQAALNDYAWNRKRRILSDPNVRALADKEYEDITERNRAAANPVSGNTIEAESAARRDNAATAKAYAQGATTAMATDKQQADKDLYTGNVNLIEKQAKLDADRAKNVTTATSQLANSMIDMTGKFANQTKAASANAGGAGGKKNLFDGWGFKGDKDSDDIYQFS